MALTDSSGNAVNTYSYDPYGNTVSSTGSTSNPFRFDGAYLDSTGFYKMGERFYDPSVARWTQMDRIPGILADPRTLNRYVFVLDDPANYVDLVGTSELGQCVGIGIAAAAGAAIGAAATGPAGAALAAAGGFIGGCGGVYLGNFLGGLF